MAREQPLDRFCWDCCPNGEPIVLFFWVKEFSPRREGFKRNTCECLKVGKITAQAQIQGCQCSEAERVTCVHQGRIQLVSILLSGKEEQTGEGSVAVPLPGIQPTEGIHSRVTNAVCVEGKGKNLILS